MLSDYAVGRDNNFNLMRFAAATGVVASHSVAVTQGADAYSPLRAAIGMDVGNVAVDIFFVTSGFLVSGSLLKRSLSDFTWARIRRVYPAYLLSLLFCILVGAYATTRPLAEYFVHPATARFAIKNGLLLLGSAFNLPGVFEELPVSGVVNGSLWTLPWEGRMYVALGMIGGIAAIFKSRKPVAGIICLVSGTLLLAKLTNGAIGFLPAKGLQVAYMFFAGAVLYLCKEKIRLSSTIATGFCALLVCAAFRRPVFDLSYLILFPYVVLAAAFLPSGSIRKFNQAGDYSYGIYIYSFPIQQLLVLKLAIGAPAIMFSVSFILTMILAFFSWHWIEQPFLAAKPKTSTVASTPKVATQDHQSVTDK